MTTASVKEVAQRAGVSVGTVSNVLNRPEVVAEATRDRVRAAMLELNFVRNESARQLRMGKGRMIGVVVLDIGNPFFTDLARGAEAAAESHGLAIMLCGTDERADKQATYLSLLEEQRVRGLLISPVNPAEPSLLELRRRGTPMVLVDVPVISKDQCSVSVDDRRGGLLAAEHLFAQGHKRIAFVGGPARLHQLRDRLEGVRSAARTHGGHVSVVRTAALTVAAGRTSGHALLDGPPERRPTAVVCGNDLVAMGMLQAMTQRGVRVPDGMAIVGYDDIEFAAAAAVPLTSVRQPSERIGRVATELLIEELDDAEHHHQQVSFEPELVIRQSSDASS